MQPAAFVCFCVFSVCDVYFNEETEDRQRKKKLQIPLLHWLVCLHAISVYHCEFVELYDYCGFILSVSVGTYRSACVSLCVSHCVHGKQLLLIKAFRTAASERRVLKPE